MRLRTNPNIPDPDGFYEELMDSQRNMTDAETQAMNARLILVLANHIGDREALSEAIRLAARPKGAA